MGNIFRRQPDLPELHRSLDDSFVHLGKKHFEWEIGWHRGPRLEPGLGGLACGTRNVLSELGYRDSDDLSVDDLVKSYITKLFGCNLGDIVPDAEEFPENILTLQYEKRLYRDPADAECLGQMGMLFAYGILLGRDMEIAKQAQKSAMRILKKVIAVKITVPDRVQLVGADWDGHGVLGGLYGLQNKKCLREIMSYL